MRCGMSVATREWRKYTHLRHNQRRWFSPLNWSRRYGCYSLRQPFLRNNKRHHKSRKQQREQNQSSTPQRRRQHLMRACCSAGSSQHLGNTDRLLLRRYERGICALSWFLSFEDLLWFGRPLGPLLVQSCQLGPSKLIAPTYCRGKKLTGI